MSKHPDIDSNPHGFAEILADMDLIIEQEHGSEFGARSLKEHLISFRDRIESALASAEPVAYEERMRPVWDERAPWTPWERCSRESYENFASKPNPWISNDWEIQRRSLYTHAQPAAKVSRRVECGSNLRGFQNVA